MCRADESNGKNLIGMHLEIAHKKNFPMSYHSNFKVSMTGEVSMKSKKSHVFIKAFERSKVKNPYLAWYT